MLNFLNKSYESVIKSGQDRIELKTSHSSLGRQLLAHGSELAHQPH